MRFLVFLAVFVGSFSVALSEGTSPRNPVLDAAIIRTNTFPGLLEEANLLPDSVFVFSDRVLGELGEFAETTLVAQVDDSTYVYINYYEIVNTKVDTAVVRLGRIEASSIHEDTWEAFKGALVREGSASALETFHAAISLYVDDDIDGLLDYHYPAYTPQNLDAYDTMRIVSFFSQADRALQKQYIEILRAFRLFVLEHYMLGYVEERARK